MKTVANIFGGLSFVTSVIGLVLFFSIGADFIIWFALFSLLSSIINVIWGEQNGLTTEEITAIIGAIIAGSTKLTLLQGVSIALCFGDAIFQIIGWVTLLAFNLRMLREIHK